MQSEQLALTWQVARLRNGREMAVELMTVSSILDCESKRDARCDCLLVLMRHSTEAFGRISYIFLMKVDSNLEVDLHFALRSCNFTTGGVFLNAPDNTGNPTNYIRLCCVVRRPCSSDW